MATWTYLPILKWKLGERIALRNLKADQWSGIVPLIELMPIVSAPDMLALRKALPPYLAEIAKELEASFPEDGVLAVDVRHVSAEFPRKVVLLEAGPPDRSPWIHMPAALDKLFNHPVLNWNYETEAEPALEA